MAKKFRNTPWRELCIPRRAPPNTMPIRYITRPLANSNRTTAQMDYRGTKSHAEVLALVLTRLNGAPYDPAKVITTYTHVLLELIMDSWQVEGADDNLGFAATVGGSQDSPDFAPTWDNLNVTLTGHLGQAGVILAQSLFSAEKTGDQGRVVPVVIRVTNMVTGLADHYSAGKPMQLELQNQRAKFNRNAGGKVTFRASNGTAVDVSEYAFIRGTVIAFNAPPALTGPQELSVTCSVGGALRTGIYPMLLLP